MSESLAAFPFGVCALALLGALGADIFWALADLEAFDLAVLGGRLAPAADFFAATLVLTVVFLAVRLALLTVFLTGAVKAVARFLVLFFAVFNVFFAVDVFLRVVLRDVLGAARFALLVVALTVDLGRLAVFFIGRFAVLADFFAADLVLPAFFAPVPLAPGVFFLIGERRVLAAFLTIERLDGVAFLTAAFVFRADRWTPDFF